MVEGQEKKKAIFLDELTWMARGAKEDFLVALDSFWNSFAYLRKDILLIVSASATSWLLKNIVHSKKGIHHRLDHTLYLKPFTLAETEEYAKARGLNKRRWPIEEFFRFMKQEFCLERFEIRSLRAIGNFFLIVRACCCFIGQVIAEKGWLYETCMSFWEGFGDDRNGATDAQRYGKSELRLYRVKRGIQAILAHTSGRPEIKKRIRKPKPNQLYLF